MGKVTKNFNPTEFECPDCGMINVQMELIDSLQLLANRIGRIKVNSACRCKKHNAEVGGKPDSMHLLGIAADIEPLDCNLERFKYVLRELYEANVFGGVIIYDTFAHVDKRRIKYFKGEE
jgi:uncharacterized protein YcbK (DUF882 family)